MKKNTFYPLFTLILALFKLKKLFFILLLCTAVYSSQAQLGFCSGNYGTPIFIDTFGTGANTSLPEGTTTYRHDPIMPNNGSYNVSGNTNMFNWHNIKDHTKGDTRGRMLIVNADYSPGEFYVTTISGLCENTTYEFSSWVINLLPISYICNPRIPINVRFEIWDSTDTNLLASGSTGKIVSTSKPNWEQYALVFQTKVEQTSVILKMINNGAGGCGNDLAIDDIMFRACGDSASVVDSKNNSENISVKHDELPYSLTLTAIPDFSVFSSHFYQWQESKNGVKWVNIVGENSHSLSITNVNSEMFYRVLFTETPANLQNPNCNVASKAFEIKITESTITHKKITIVKDGLSIIYDRVWIDGVVGKFVQTSEETIKQGNGNATVIEETIYRKAKYGYNSTTRTYSIEKENAEGNKN